MSDLLFIGFHPVLSTGDPENWMRLLKETRRMDPTMVVPGHGAVGDVNDLDEMGAYITSLSTIMSKLVDDGLREEQIEEIHPPEPYESWLYARFFYGNMHFLYNKYSNNVKSA